MKQKTNINRPNTLPKLFPSESQNIQKQGISSPDDQSPELKRQQIRELMVRSEMKNTSRDEPRNPSLIESMREQKKKDIQTRSIKTNELFAFSTVPNEMFGLPGKPEPSTSGALPSPNRKSTTRKLKIRENKGTQNPAEDVEIEGNEYSFLSGVLGYSKPNEKESDFEMKSEIQQHESSQHAKSSDQDEVAAILSSIQTGDDAIQFFARYGSETPVKFIHLVQVQDPKEYRPYDLMTTELRNGPMGEYFTMSPLGIVRHAPGEPSECTRLMAWMRQSLNFKILRKIGFFKYYLHKKTFNTWRENVRFQLFAKQKKKVTERLFLARKTCCPAILATKTHLLEVQKVKLLQTDFKTCDKDHFSDLQTAQCLKASALSEDSMKRVVQEVQNVIAEVNSMHSQALQDKNSHLLSFADDIQAEKTKSIVKIKQEKAEKKLLRQKAKLEYSTLPEFIRFIDFLTVETFITQAISSMDSFHEEFVKNRKQGIFETTVRFTKVDTFFSPTCVEILEMLENLFDTVVNTVGGVNRVNYLAEGKGSNPSSNVNIQTIVRDNRQFNHIIRSIKSRVEEDFKLAVEHAKSYEAVRPIYIKNEEWDVEGFRAQQHEIGDLKKLLEEITGWTTRLDKLRNKQIGILDVDSRRLRGELMPQREARLFEVKEYIKDLARNKSSMLLERYKESINKLASRPTALKDYASQVQIISQMREEEKAILKATSQVDHLYNLLQQYDVSVPSEDIVLHEELHEKQADYKKDIEVAQSYRESKTNEMVSNVDSNIAKLQDQVAIILVRMQDPIFNDSELFDEPGKVLEEIAAVGQRLDNVDQNFRTLTGYQKLFGVPVFESRDMENCKEKWEGIKQLWETLKNWNDKHTLWSEMQFTDLPVEELEKDVQVFFKDSYALNKKLGNKVCETLRDKIMDFKTCVPVVLDLGNPKMRSRHYEKVFKLLNLGYYEGMPFSLSLLLKAGCLNFKDEIGEISGSASGEAQLEDSLALIKTGWEKMKFTVINYRDQHGLFILGSLEEIIVLLEDNQVTLQTMLGSRFIRGIQDKVEEWEKKLASLSETLDEWVVCQRSWMYLENIFGAEDIQKQLPAESQRFLVVDRSFKSIMLRTFNDPLVLNTLLPLDNGSSLLDTFLMNNSALESIQKSLEEYLETKRMAFPRFYFLSNDELLEILSQTRDPHAVQPHMSKCFDAIKRIKFGEGRSHAHDILGFLDPGGEYVPLSDHVRAEGLVEAWLLNFEKGMRSTLFNLCKAAYTQYPKAEDGAIDRKAWLWAYPAQVVIAVDQVIWTENCGLALLLMQGKDDDPPDPEAMRRFLNFSLRQIDAMVDLVRLPLDKQQRTLLGALLTIDVHARDVVRAMVARDTNTLSDFEWTRQLRYVWDAQEDDIFVKQTNSSFRYGYEYLGNGPRLVITPLTDTCYMTLTGALHMKLGGAPAGPAGTGKTETTKDLAKALAVYCVVFNCSDGLDFQIMGQFFSGLAQQGAWACFDEFNRIDIEVLSVIAQQVLCIQRAIITRVKQFEFEGTIIPINPAFGVFITMNPGYAGRTELPDNLKSLFRPVAMMVPDYRLIAEIMLFSEGFQNALPLSNKMAQLYALSSEQLSKQSHYDFGMRAVKSVLVAAGQLKRKEPDSNEDILLIRAMRDSNVPKFLEQDLPLFQGILLDLFPGIKVPYVDYGKLQKAIEATLDSLNLQKVPVFITKVIQVHETQLVRHGMMVVGESGSGKTTNVMVLAQALKSLYEEKVVDRDGFYKPVDRLILNPKSITAGELYGEFNNLTGEWKDGIVPKLVRDCVVAGNEGSENRKWIIFDGPVDAIWIENMNTVLDDNKTLCLANSERIKLPSTLHMLFEVQDLKVASPATVSRCGMVYMEQVHVGMLSLVKTWGLTELKRLTGLKSSRVIVQAIEANLEPAIEFIRYECKEKVATSNNQLTTSFLNLFASHLNEDPEPKLLGQDPDLMMALLIWCFVWSIGANLHDSSRHIFQDWLQKRFATSLPSKYAPLLTDLQGSYVDLQTREIKTWVSAMLPFRYDPAQPYFSVLVPTIDTTCHRFVLDKLMRYGSNVLFMAETGVGKSVIINSFLNEMVAAGQTVSYVMGYSAQTKPANLRDVLETKLEKKRKNLYGPPAGKKMFFFIDDLNMPAVEKFGAQPPNELLRQCIDQGGFYDVQKLFFKHISDVVFVSACAPPGGGRNEISPRLLRHFHMVWLTSLSEASMVKIFSNILNGFIMTALPQFAPLADPLVQSSVNIYLRIQQELLPTPMKSHYTFNLRDLSKIFQGILMVKPHNIPSKDSLVRLWCHESSRVFRDRLINEQDRDWFDDTTLQQIRFTLGSPEWQKDDFVNVIYGNFLTRQNKEYKELLDRTKVGELLVENLDEYNVTFPSRMELVFFTDAVNHICRIARILAQPRGNALLVGVGGSGRQSLTRMASFMADYKCRQIEITRGYGMNEWHDNLKEILMNAGAKNLPTVFLFSDTQIVTETFLEDINNILNSGEVPNLYENDELERIVGMVRPLVKGASTREAILQHYIYLVRENLHIVLCMSPIGAGFRTRCRMFPSLVNCCTIDWFNAWPEDALCSVAQRMFQAQKELGIEDIMVKLSNLCNKMHRVVEIETSNYLKEVRRHNYTTPTSYLELIKLYVDILKKQQTKVSSNERRYRVGLDKILETESIVNVLESKLKEMQPVIEQATKDTEVLIVQVTADQKDADAQQTIVETDVAEANKVAASVKIIKDDCQADLDLAMPAFNSAVKALETLDKKAIQEMKGFNNPPELVKFTLEAVCILLEVKPDWSEAKKLMSAMDFMDQLKVYDKDNISPKLIKRVEKYYNDPRFLPEIVNNQSSAARCLCMWVRAMVDYDRVAKNIEPKKQALLEAEVQLSAVQAELSTKKAALKLVLDRVAGLQSTLRDTQQKKAQLEEQRDQDQKRLVRAGQLLGGLGGEKVRWQESASKLRDSLRNLVGDMLLAAGCLAYLGPFTSQFRSRIVHQWVQISNELEVPCGGHFSLLSALAEPVVLRAWQIDGLPADDFSCENGLLSSMGRRWPLMIDPQGQANRWVRNTYSSKNLQIIKLTEKDFLRTLENGIRYGAPVLLENVGQELDPSLEPVLLKQVFRKAGQQLLRLGDTDVPYSDEFRFMITTKLANPHYMPEVCIKVTIINFTVTMRGLEDQLLVDVIRNERPDLEERKDKLVLSIANDQKQLLEIEEQILSMLANASGNILDDEQLINALARSKTTSMAVNSRLSEAEKTTVEINETREMYRVVAQRGSVIYFVVANLAMIDPMYQYSLQYYKDLFNQRLKKTEKKEVLQERLDLLIDDITHSIYTNICRGLFEKDKLLFAFMISVKIELASGAVSEPEWLMFMVGPVMNHDTLTAHPMPEVLKHLQIHERTWSNAVMLESDLKGIFNGLCRDISTEPTKWQYLFISDNPHQEPLPGRWEGRLNPFQKLLLLRVIREEKVFFAVRCYLERTIGKYYTESPPFDLEGAYSDSLACNPLIFVLSPGADPTDYLLQLADSKGKGGSSLKIISLGQGQGPIAEKAIEMAQRMGEWICLQNCHLAVSWLSKLEQMIEKMQNDPDSIHKEFRLWLTSMPSAAFPVPVLQNGIKVTNEPPRGLKANLMRTFLDISPDEYESCTKPAIYKKLIFATAFFNALILERRKFGAVGWNIPYDWMNSDLKAASTQVRMYLEEQPQIPWETLNVSVAFITYGGRVTDVWDKRTIMSILRKYFCEDLLEEGFLFGDERYRAPEVGDIFSLREYIRQLPVEDDPQVFGLHSNAAISFQQKESKTFINTAVTCSGGGSGGDGGGGDNDKKVQEIATTLTARMPSTYDLRKAHPDTFRKIGDATTSLGVFLSQELIRFNELIVVMHATLRELQRAIKGEVVMSGELEVMYNCFVFQKVPPAWEEAGYPCLKPLLSWIEDFMERIRFMGQWLVEGPRPCYWLSGFFFPQGFMTAVKQTYSRESRIAVDTLKIGCEITNSDPEKIHRPPEIGAYVYGLFMEGGRFDRSSMNIQDTIPRQMLDVMPVIWLKPVIASEYKPQGVYDCPLYKTSIRAGTLSTTGHSTNFVVALPIPTAAQPDHWIRRGCALLCMQDD